MEKKEAAEVEVELATAGVTAEKKKEEVCQVSRARLKQKSMSSAVAPRRHRHYKKSLRVPRLNRFPRTTKAMARTAALSFTQTRKAAIWPLRLMK